METDIPIAEQKSSFKLIKNSRGYNWEIKVYDEDMDLAFKKTVQMNKKAQAEWGLQDD